MALSSLDLGELVEDWTLLDEERKQVGDKRGPARLGFTLLLKFYTRFGRFPRDWAELPDEAVDFVGRQVQVAAAELGSTSGLAGRSSRTAPRSASISGSACALSWTRRS